MQKLIILFYVLATFLTVDAQTKKITKQGDFLITDEGYINIIGIAKEDGKGGALIEVDSYHRYFVKGLRRWPKNVFGKKIKARGRCITVDQRKLLQRNPLRQGYPIKNTLNDVKWKIVG